MTDGQTDKQMDRIFTCRSTPPNIENFFRRPGSAPDLVSGQQDKSGQVEERNDEEEEEEAVDNDGADDDDTDYNDDGEDDEALFAEAGEL